MGGSNILKLKAWAMRLTHLAAGTAILLVLGAQSAPAQPAPPPDQPGPAQSAPPPPPDQPGPPPPAGALSGPEQPGPPPPGAPQPGPPPQAGGPPPGVVNTNVNLRQGPGTNYNILATIPAGAPVAVSGCSGGQWCQVTFQGQSGYVIATSLGQRPPPGPPRGPYPPGYVPPPPGYPPPYPPPYYGPYPYYGGYYGPGPYWRRRGYYGGGYHRHW
jgi:SH3 domain-containing protein